MTSSGPVAVEEGMVAPVPLPRDIGGLPGGGVGFGAADATAAFFPAAFGAGFFTSLLLVDDLREVEDFFAEVGAGGFFLPAATGGGEVGFLGLGLVGAADFTAGAGAAGAGAAASAGGAAVSTGSLL